MNEKWHNVYAIKTNGEKVLLAKVARKMLAHDTAYLYQSIYDGIVDDIIVEEEENNND